MRGLLLDLDGVLYVGDEPVAGAAQAVGWFREHDVPHRFLTNTTSRPREAIVAKLASMGLEVGADEVITPAVAAVAWLRERAIERPALFVPGATAAEFAMLSPLPDGLDGTAGGAGAVVVGDLGRGWDFDTLNRAFRLLMADPAVPLVALGLTRYWRAEDGLRLDAGPYVRALEYATGREAVVLGKPDAGFYRSAVSALGLEGPGTAAATVMVGDDVRGDVGGAQAAGLVGVLVRTGKFSSADLDGAVVPDAVLDSVADLPGWWGSA
ncbi:TIGR01458 family HAD-type hydrolase [Nocardioides sp. GCM10027113]|uniref:TIGR01458 family HAD-type hydrolase n=1 Tax=unclassified Nocardioides TaxID=2615069 RepID=UPI00360FF28D